MALLEVRDLSISFGGLWAVRDLALTLAEQEIMAVIGPNGAGKTTFFNLVTGFLKPIRGRLLFDGRDITGLEPHRIARHGIVRTFQSTKVFPNLTVLQGIRAGCHQRVRSSFRDIMFRTSFFRDEDRAIAGEAQELLEFTGLAARRNDLAKDLSYGQQRLLEVAIALGAKPRVLLLDEPAAGMNPDETNRMIDLVTRIRARGVTVMLVEHNMYMVMGISDRIVCLNYGRKIAEGTPQAIQSHPEVIAAYLGKGVECA